VNDDQGFTAEEPERTRINPRDEPVVKLVKGQLDRSVAATHRHLLKTELYQRGAKIVWPSFIQVADGKGDEVKIPGIVRLNKHHLRLYVMEYIAYKKWNKTGGEDGDE
jgi:hypothetical protein